MCPYIETNLGEIRGVSISVISENNKTQTDIINEIINHNNTQICEGNRINNGSYITIHFTLPKENRFGIIQYDTVININLFEIVLSGLEHGFYDRLIISTIDHYVQQNHFSEGFKQATYNYKTLYDNGNCGYWGLGLQKVS